MDLIRTNMGRPWEEREARARPHKVTHVRIYNEKSAYRCAPQGVINQNIVFAYENSDFFAHKIFQNRIYAQFYK